MSVYFFHIYVYQSIDFNEENESLFFVQTYFKTTYFGLSSSFMMFLFFVFFMKH